jgi:hypothetical protein
MSNSGLLNDTFVLYVSIIIFALLGLIWYTRYSFTRGNRDSEHWNRLKFPEDGKKGSPLSSSVLNSVATATTEKCNKNKLEPPGGTTTRRRSSWERDQEEPPADSGIDYSMFAGQRYGFFTEQTHPGSAAARSMNGTLYGDRDDDGRLGNWDTTDGGFDEYPEDVSTVNLEQGRNYNSLYVGNGIYVADTGAQRPTTMDGRLAYCLSNPGAYDSASNVPCKQFWCRANPSLSWTTPAVQGPSGSILYAATSVPCRTLFPNL